MLELNKFDQRTRDWTLSLILFSYSASSFLFGSWISMEELIYSLILKSVWLCS